MARIHLGRGIVDDFEVTPFGLAAYEGNLPLVKELLRADPKNLADPMALYLCLRAGRKEIFSFLLESGIQCPKSVYGYVLFEDPSFLSLLPPDPEALAMGQARQKSFALSKGLLDGTLRASEVRQLIHDGADARNPVLVTTSERNFFPVHLAALKPELRLMKELIRAGVDPRMEGPLGKNAVRMVLENPRLSRKERRDFHRLFRNADMAPTPGLSVGDQLRLFLGLPIRTSPPETSSSCSRSS